VDAMELSEIFASELAQCPGFSVVRPKYVLAAAQQEKMVQDGGVVLKDPAEAVQLARAVGADAIIVAGITEYNVYYPPRVAIALQLFSDKPAIAERQPLDIEKLIQSGRPCTISPQEKDSTVASFEDVIDSNQLPVRYSLRGYANIREKGDTAFKDEEQFLYKDELYFQFCSDYLIRHFVKMYLEKEKQRELDLETK
jgi:hypothetical protein